MRRVVRLQRAPVFLRQDGYEFGGRQFASERCALPRPLRPIACLVRSFCGAVERLAGIVSDRVGRYLPRLDARA